MFTILRLLDLIRIIFYYMIRFFTVLSFLWLFFVVTTRADESHLSLEAETDMAWVPPGAFPFGTDQKDNGGEALSFGIPKPWYSDETPKRRIVLKGFYIDRFEVTNRRYKIYVDAVGAVSPGYWIGSFFPEGKEDHPVVWVNWYDAANFCSWAGKRLPTEKEWERAAKGPQGLEYPWGNEFKIENANLANHSGSKNSVGAVGEHPAGASTEGVHDLIGNVWEWTATSYIPYEGNDSKNPELDDGTKTLRGASASYVGHFPGGTYEKVLSKIARNGFRQPAQPDQGAEDVGFRCVSDLEVDARVSEPSPLNPFQSLSRDSRGLETTPNINPFEAKTNLPESGFWVLVFLSLLAGLFSFLSPCTLPILPAYFAVTAQADRARVTLMSFAFFCGLASLFVMMGASASFFGKFLRDYLFSLTYVGGILVTIFGVMTILGKGFSGATFKSQPASTLIGSFFFGATFALGWTPCVGPVLSGILILAASEKTILQGMSLLFFYAVGLGMPLIIIATFFGNLKKDGLFWRTLRGKGWEIKIAKTIFLLHSTNLFSGLLLIGLGLALATGYMTYLNSIIPIELQVWFSKFEEKLLHGFM